MTSYSAIFLPSKNGKEPFKNKIIWHIPENKPGSGALNYSCEAIYSQKIVQGLEQLFWMCQLYLARCPWSKALTVFYKGHM